MENDIVSRLVSDDPEKRFELRDFTIGGKTTPKYPGEWFAAHPRAKPSLTLPKYVGWLDSLRQTVVHNIVTPKKPNMKEARKRQQIWKSKGYYND